ncbi:MAG: alkaline phosphatase family protein [Chloroflexota bacterium]|nr:MAG: alkaline phosphatase family protein [Chloroflexota bacterium]
MPDLTEQLLPDMRAHRLPGFNLGGDYVYPDYEGRSLVNVPASICLWLGVPTIGASPLAAQLTTSLQGQYQNVILILMDALSLNLFTKLLNAGKIPVWEKLIEGGILAPLTSITPSTTAAALTSLWTGTGAIEHGIVGYEMWLKEYGMVVNSILQAPMSFRGGVGSLEKTGFEPESFIRPTLLGTHLSNHGIESHGFQHQSIARSGLSRMLLQDVKVSPFRSQSDLWSNLRSLLRNNPDERKFVWVYWGEVDYFSHNYGPDDERTMNELVNFSDQLGALFLDQLNPAIRTDTLLILMADHGQINTQPDPHYDLSNHPGLTRRLHIMPTGENRLAFLYLRPGQGEAAREYIERTWPGQFAFLDPVFAVEAGLFGIGEPHPRLFDRIGDLIVVARGSAYWWWSKGRDHLEGRHGGLSADEMLVPFLAAGL